MVTHQLQVQRWTGKDRRLETDVLPLSHAANHMCVCVCIYCIVLFDVRHPDFHDANFMEGEQRILLSVLPFFHSYGMMTAVILALAGGVHVISLPRFILKEVLSCIEKYRVSEVQGGAK